MNPLIYKPFYRRHLPHIQPPGAMLFVTYRLAGSLPQHVVAQLLAEGEAVERRLAHMPRGPERARLAYEEQRRLFGRWDKMLDTNREGPHWLRRPEIASLVASSLHFLNGRRYDLDCYCLMSNHVHVVLTPLAIDGERYHALTDIMHSLKGYTANKANRQLGRSGSFWQHESYDHVVRDAAEWLRIRHYVVYNPVKAGLVKEWQEWPWTYCKALSDESTGSPSWDDSPESSALSTPPYSWDGSPESSTVSTPPYSWDDSPESSAMSKPPYSWDDSPESSALSDPPDSSTPSDSP